MRVDRPLQVSHLISKPSEVRDLLSKDIFVSKDPMDRVTLLINTLPKAVKVSSSHTRQTHTGRKPWDQIVQEEVSRQEEK